MATCTYIMFITGLLSVVGLAVGLRKSPYRHQKTSHSKHIKIKRPLKTRISRLRIL